MYNIDILMGIVPAEVADNVNLELFREDHFD